MDNCAFFGKKLQHLCSLCFFKLASFCRSICFLVMCFYRFVHVRVSPFLFQFFYFISVSSLGFWLLKVLKPRTYPFRPKNLDLFFMSVSATTVSSMSTVEMEVFSNTQLIVLTLLMFIGGEVFISIVGLHLRTSKLKQPGKTESKAESVNRNTICSSSSPPSFHDQIELGPVTKPVSDNSKPEIESSDVEFLKCKSINFLGFVVLGYFIVVHVFGVALVLLYLTVISSAGDVLKNKGLKAFTFSLFTIVSTFTNCGFIPTNENMMVFRKNSGLLLLLIPQVLLGNTLFPSCLRFFIRVLGKFVKKEESNYVLKNTREIGYPHLLPSLHSSLLVVTVFGFILVQFTLFCSMEWNSEALNGLNSYQKFVGVLFQCVNSRHTGETIVDLSIIYPAILVLFVIMMYLPPYTTFLPMKGDQEECPQENEKNKKRREKVVESIMFSQLACLAMFVILICITERENTKEDPLNFTVLNIVVEVISAYGNVGFTTGYSCDRQLKPEGTCQNKWFGFSGKWSDEGKIILIAVMFFGRLKKFNMDGGKAWKLQ